MIGTEARDTGDREPTPAESLALIDATLRQTRGALGLSEWPFYLIWGLAWGVAFTLTHLVTSSPGAPLAHLPVTVLGLVWPICIGAAIAATGWVAARTSRGVGGTSARVGRRLAVSWAASFPAAVAIGGLLGLSGHEFGALLVLVAALLYVGQGAAFLDDLQLGTGLWLLVVDVVALALGPARFNLVLAVFGAGGLLVAAALARRGSQRAERADG